jgi:tetratricopeptide (TPR) repeat protein
MPRSNIVLTLILIVVVGLTAVIIKRPPAAKETRSLAAARFGSTMSLSPYRYNHDLGISSIGYPEYSIDDFLERGYELLRNGDNKKAEDILKTALLFDSDNPDTIKSIGEITYVDGRYLEACNYFTQYLTLRPKAVESYTNLSISCIQAGNLDLAESISQKGLTELSEKECGPIYFVLACVKQGSGQTKEAFEYLTKAYYLLGADVLKLVNSSWSSSIKDLPGFQSILIAATSKDRLQPQERAPKEGAPQKNE